MSSAATDAEILRQIRSTPAPAPAQRGTTPAPAAFQPARTLLSDEDVLRQIRTPFPSETQFAEASQEGGTLMQRLAASFKFNPESTEKFLASQLGRENVFTGPEGELFFLPEDQQQLPRDQAQLVKFNPRGLDVGDIVEFVPAAIIGAGAAGAIALTAPASLPAIAGAAAVGGAAGAGAKQAIGEALPGSEADVTAGQRAREAAGEGALEGVFSTIPGAVALGRSALRGTGEAAQLGIRRAASRGREAFVQAGRELGERTGINFTVGQLSNNLSALNFEGALRRSIFSLDVVAGADRTRLETLSKLVDTTIGRVGKSEGLESARAATVAYDKFLGGLFENRRKVTKELFDEFRNISGDAELFSFGNTLTKVNALIERAGAKIGPRGDKNVELLNTIKERLLAKLGPGPVKRVPASKFADALVDITAATRNPKELVTGFGDDAYVLRVARELQIGMQQDMLEATTKGGLAGPAAQSLDRARTTYREMSEAINNIEGSTIGEFADNIEGLAKELMRTGTGDNARSVFQFLDKNAPAEAQALRASVLENILQKQGQVKTAAAGALPKLGSDVPGEVLPISPANLVKAIRNETNRAVLERTFAGDKTTLAAINDLAAAAQRLSTNKLEGSPTALLQRIFDVLQGAGAGGSVAFATTLIDEPGKLAVQGAITGATVLTNRFLARTMTDPQQIRNLSKLMRAAASRSLDFIRRAPNSRRVRVLTQAAADLASFATRQQQLDELNQQPPEALRR